MSLGKWKHSAHRTAEVKTWRRRAASAKMDGDSMVLPVAGWRRRRRLVLVIFALSHRGTAAKEAGQETFEDKRRETLLLIDGN